MVTTKLPAVLEWSYLVAYFGGVFGVWIIGTLISRYVLRRSGAAPAIAGMTAGFSNNVLLGVPLVLNVRGSSYAAAGFIITATHGCCCRR